MFFFYEIIDTLIQELTIQHYLLTSNATCHSFALVISEQVLYDKVRNEHSNMKRRSLVANNLSTAIGTV